MNKEEKDRIMALRREFGAMIAKAEKEGLVSEICLKDCFVGYCSDNEIDHIETKYY